MKAIFLTLALSTSFLLTAETYTNDSMQKGDQNLNQGNFRDQTKTGTEMIKNSTSTDEYINKQVRNILSGSFFSRGYENVSFDIVNGYVNLRGTVAKAEDKAKIEKALEAIPGIKGVNSQITVQETASDLRSSDTKKSDFLSSKDSQKYQGNDAAATDSDRLLNQKIRDKLNGGWFSKNFNNSINLKTSNGIVTVTGVLDNSDDISRVLIEIRKIDGVKSVNNQVTSTR